MRKVDPIVDHLQKAMELAKKKKLPKTAIAIDSALFAVGFELFGKITKTDIVRGAAYLAKNAKQIMPKVSRMRMEGVPPHNEVIREWPSKWNAKHFKWLVDKHLVTIRDKHPKEFHDILKYL